MKSVIYAGVSSLSHKLSHFLESISIRTRDISDRLLLHAWHMQGKTGDSL